MLTKCDVGTEFYGINLGERVQYKGSALDSIPSFNSFIVAIDITSFEQSLYYVAIRYDSGNDITDTKFGDNNDIAYCEECEILWVCLDELIFFDKQNPYIELKELEWKDKLGEKNG